MRRTPSAWTCWLIVHGVDVAVVRLAAGHGDGVVVEDLVGDGGVGRDGVADRQIAGMEIGAVAQVLEDVRHVGEVAGADPGRALAAHLGEGLGVALHVDAPACGSRCRPSPSSPRAPWSRCCAGSRSRNRARAPCPASLRTCRPAAALQGLEALPGAGAEAPRGRSGRRSPRRSRRASSSPSIFSSFWPRSSVLPTTTGRRSAGALNSASLSCCSMIGRFSSTTRISRLPSAKAVAPCGLERPDHGDLVDGEPEPLGLGVVDAELVQRLAHVEIGLADGDDAEARVGPAHHQRGRACWRASRRAPPACLIVMHAPLLAQPVVGPADVHAVGRQLEVGRDLDLDAMRIDIDRGRGIDRLAQHLEADPQAASSATSRSRAGRNRDTPGRRRHG